MTISFISRLSTYICPEIRAKKIISGTLKVEAVATFVLALVGIYALASGHHLAFKTKQRASIILCSAGGSLFFIVMQCAWDNRVPKIRYQEAAVLEDQPNGILMGEVPDDGKERGSEGLFEFEYDDNSNDHVEEPIVQTKEPSSSKSQLPRASSQPNLQLPPHQTAGSDTEEDTFDDTFEMATSPQTPNRGSL